MDSQEYFVPPNSAILIAMANQPEYLVSNTAGKYSLIHTLGELRVVTFRCRCRFRFRCGSRERSRKVLSIAVNLGLCNQFHCTSALQDH